MLNAEFIKGIVGDDALLADGRPQVAMIGRSNVGKSSTINALVNRKSLARESKSPGKTREINAYFVDKSWYLLDLPGYGYAKGSHSERDRLHTLVDWYLLSPKSKPALIIVIIDAKVGPTKDDVAMIDAIAKAGKPLLIAANKVDKVSKPQRDAQFQIIADILGESVLPYSANKGEGLSELRNYITEAVKKFR